MASRQALLVPKSLLQVLQLLVVVRSRLDKLLEMLQEHNHQELAHTLLEPERIHLALVRSRLEPVHSHLVLVRSHLVLVRSRPVQDHTRLEGSTEQALEQALWTGCRQGCTRGLLLQSTDS